MAPGCYVSCERPGFSFDGTGTEHRDPVYPIFALVGALTLLHHGAATRFPPTNQLFNDLILEGEAVAKKLGITLHGDPRQLVQKGATAPGKHNASMLQDVLAKRQTEVDFMNGAIVQLGEKVGVPAPLNKALWELIKGLERSWSDPD